MKTPKPSVLVIGSGPAGLAVSACLQRRDVGFRFIDSHGIAGGAYQRMYSGMTLVSPSRYNALPGLALKTAGEYTTVPEYRSYLLAYAAHHRLVPEKAQVVQVEKVEEGLQVRFAGSKSSETYRCVIVATGVFDAPRWPSIEGSPSGPLSLHAHDWPGPGKFQGKKILIVGAATSAVEIAEECARAGLATIVSAREGRVKVWPQRFLGRDLHDYWAPFEKVPPFLLPSFCDGKRTLPGTDSGFGRFVKEGLIGLRREPIRCEKKRVVFSDGGTEECDVIVFATGYRLNLSFLPKEVDRRKGSDVPRTRNGESVSVPGLFFLGTPCAGGITSVFLRGIAKDAPAVAEAVARRATHT